MDQPACVWGLTERLLKRIESYKAREKAHKNVIEQQPWASTMHSASATVYEIVARELLEELHLFAANLKQGLDKVEGLD
jgi:hypothetical protein